MKNNETGRSMVEMLGVLAVVGVLSIGGIAGYRNAMAQNDANKFLENLSQFTVLVRATQETSPFGSKKIKIDQEEISYDNNTCYFYSNSDGFLDNYTTSGNWSNVCKEIAQKITPEIFEPLVGTPEINQFGFYLSFNSQRPWFSYDGKTLTEETTAEERISDCERIDNEYGNGHQFIFDMYDSDLCN